MHYPDRYTTLEYCSINKWGMEAEGGVWAPMLKAHYFPLFTLDQITLSSALDGEVVRPSESPDRAGGGA